MEGPNLLFREIKSPVTSRRRRRKNSLLVNQVIGVIRDLAVSLRCENSRFVSSLTCYLCQQLRCLVISRIEDIFQKKKTLNYFKFCNKCISFLETFIPLIAMSVVEKTLQTTYMNADTTGGPLLTCGQHSERTSSEVNPEKSMDKVQ